MTTLDPPAPLQTPPGPPHDPRYSVGTLHYTKFSLIVMFCWMLFGNVAFHLMERIFPISMPLQLARLGVPVAWMPVLMVTFGQVMNMFLSPIISFRSDRTRTRWGRRMPYIMLTLPFLCLCLVGLGFTDQIGYYIRHAAWVAHLGIPPLVIIMVVIGLLVVLYNFFNDFVNTVYWYLYADLIPVAFLGRYSGLSSLVGGAVGAAFSYFVYGQIEKHSREVYIGAAILYAIGMTMLCWRVREGQYPPPTDEPRTVSRWRAILVDIRTYFRECFCHPIYITYYVYTSLRALTNSTSFAIIFFYVYYLGFTMDRMGKYGALLGLVGMLTAFPIGWLIDKMHPMRALLIGAVCLIPLNFASFFMHTFTTYMIIAALRLLPGQLMGIASGPFNVELLPRKQYGQFCSANDMLRSFVLIFGSVAGGLFVGYFHTRYGLAGYASLWLWVIVFDVLALGCLLVLWRYWRRMGGVHFAFDPEICAPTNRGSPA